MNKSFSNAGEFKFRFEWLSCVRSPDGITGDSPKTYPSSGVYLWGAYEAQTGQEQNQFGATRSVTSGQVRFRGFPTISTLDRLRYVNYNEIYDISGIHRDFEANETVVDVESVNRSGA